MNVIACHCRMHYSTLDTIVEVQSMSTHVEGGGGIPYHHVTLNHTKQIFSVKLHVFSRKICYRIFLRYFCIEECHVIYEHLKHENIKVVNT